MPSTINNTNTNIINNSNNNTMNKNIFNHGEFTIDKIPTDTNILIFHNRFNMMIKPGYIPDSVTHIIFGNLYNKQINLNVIPYGVKYIQFGWCFDQSIIVGSLPPSLIGLSFGNMFSKSIEENAIPSSVVQLIYGDCWTGELNQYSVPSSVKLLKLGSYNKQVKDLKKGCCSSDKIIPLKIKGTLAANTSIEQLSFGVSFNQPIPDSLLNSSIKSIIVPQTCTFNSTSIYFDKIKLF